MKLLDEFPFNCDIYRKQINESLKSTEREEEETYIMSSKCDIRYSKNMSDIYSTSVYEVSIPLVIDKVNIMNGDVFVGTFLDIAIKGEIYGIKVSMLNGCSFYVLTKSL